MSYFSLMLSRFSLMGITACMAVCVHAAIAQPKPQIQVLQMPAEMRSLPVQQAAGLLSVHYDGKLNSSRAIYVRVFRDPLDQLMKQRPRQVGECVVYTHAARFRVDHSFDRELRLTDLITFFKSAPFQNRQVLTLVFEEGDDPDSNGPLRLEAGSVAEYFKNAVEMPLVATQDTQREWDVAEQRAEKRMAEANKQPGFWDRITGQKASAKESPVPRPAPVAPLSPRIFLPPCQRVALLKYTPLTAQAPAAPRPADAGMLEALAPVAVRGDEACSQ